MEFHSFYKVFCFQRVIFRGVILEAILESFWETLKSAYGGRRRIAMDLEFFLEPILGAWAARGSKFHFGIKKAIKTNDFH